MRMWNTIKQQLENQHLFTIYGTFDYGTFDNGEINDEKINNEKINDGISLFNKKKNRV
jgi:hypothetical protein